MSETIMEIYCVNLRSITPILYFFTIFFLSRGRTPLMVLFSMKEKLCCLTPVRLLVLSANVKRHIIQ